MRAAVLLFFIVCSFSLFEPVEADGWFDNLWSTIKKKIFRTAEVTAEVIEALLDPSEDWKCGTTKIEISLNLAMAATVASCNEMSDEVNKACIQHDICYERRKGQEGCDELFCERLKNIEGCQAVAVSFCKLVKTLGHRAYNNRTEIRKHLHQKGIALPPPQQNVTDF